MKLLLAALAALVALSPSAFAADQTVGHEHSTFKPAALVVKDDAKGGDGNARFDALPPELQHLDFSHGTYSHLGAMPHVGANGLASLAPGKGIAVGFKTGVVGKNGDCSIGETGAVAHLDIPWNIWVSTAPGSAPLHDCEDFGHGGPGVTINYMPADDAWKAKFGRAFGDALCYLQPHTIYYCNAAGASGLIGAPLGIAAYDYNDTETRAMSGGKLCIPPGSDVQGFVQPDGFCRLDQPGSAEAGGGGGSGFVPQTCFLSDGTGIVGMTTPDGRCVSAGQ